LLIADLILMFDHFPEVLVLIDEHFQFVFYVFTVLLVEISSSIVVEFFNGFGEFGVYFNQFF
jgi:hypothetical protein